MRYIYALIMTIVVATMNLSAEPYNTVEVTTTGYGQLNELLGDNYLSIDSLIINGPIDEADFCTIQLASYHGKLTGINIANALLKDNRLPDLAFSAYPINYLTNGEWGNSLQLEWITLPQNVEEIGTRAFWYSKVKKLDLPPTVRKIGVAAFDHVDNLWKLDIPEGVEEIPYHCFYYANIDSINLPSTIITIADAAFEYGHNIKHIDMKSGIRKIGDCVFMECKSLRSLIFPNTIEEFGTWNFAWVGESLKELYLPDCITVMDDKLFYDFKLNQLIKLRLPQYLERIDAGFNKIFTYVPRVETLEFPETLSEIDEAFITMSSLRTAYTKRIEPATCTEYTDIRGTTHTSFEKLPEDATLYVPVGSGEAYRNAPGWKNFPNIVESDEPPVSGIKTATVTSDATIRVVNGGVEITNGNGAQYTVCGIDGRVYASGICGETQNIALSKGIYVVRVANKTLKVNI